MSEANPDPSGTTGEFRAFVEKGAAEQRRGGMRNPVVIGLAVVAAVVIIAVIVIAVG
jgi:hypothetical protein